MKNRGTIITLIILLSIVIIILVAFLILVLTGRFKGISFKTKGEVIYDNVYNLEEISKININSSAGDTIFKESNDNTFRVVCYGNNSDDANVNVSNNELNINYKESRKSFFLNICSNDTIIYIPNNFDGKINIKNDYGDINIIDLENADLRIEADCGDIKIGKINNVNLECDYGDINIDTILNKCEIEADCGDIEINNMDIKENSNINCDYGDVKIGNAPDIYIDASVSLGDIKIKDNNRHSDITLKIKNDCGDIKVD